MSYLLADKSVQCGSSDHEKMKFLAILLVLVWPVGMLLLFAFLLFYNRNELKAGEARHTSARATRFLTSGYRARFFYWEVIEVLRRLLVSGWVVLIPYENMFGRGIFVMTVSLLLLVATAVARPWVEPVDNLLALLSQGALIIAFGCCTIIRITETMADEEQVEAALGFADDRPLYFVLCFLLLGFTFVLIALFVGMAHRDFRELLAMRKRDEGRHIRPTSSFVGLSLGACILGLPAGAFGGLLYGLIGGVIFAVVSGMVGAVAGFLCSDLTRRILRTFYRCLPEALRRRSSVTSYDVLNAWQTAYEEAWGLTKQVKFATRNQMVLCSVVANVKGDVPRETSQTVPFPPSKDSEQQTEDVQHVGARVRRALNNVSPLLSREEASLLLTRVTQRIRSREYGLADFHADMVRCFPELQLYLVGCNPQADSVETSAAILKAKGEVDAGFLRAHAIFSHKEDLSRTSSGQSSHVEYCRTFGALFALYWLMRLELPEVTDSDGLGGQQAFCFGVDPETMADVMHSTYTTEDKRYRFLQTHDWTQMHKLLEDAGLLIPNNAGGVDVSLERTRAMLVLTAIHDVMKITALLPTVLEEHSPFNGYIAGEEINDHDEALSYVLMHDPEALPSYAALPANQQAPIRFTQAELGFNHGWLVQAEGPPGALLSKFKQLLDSDSFDAADIAVSAS